LGSMRATRCCHTGGPSTGRALAEYEASRAANGKSRYVSSLCLFVEGRPGSVIGVRRRRCQLLYHLLEVEAGRFLPGRELREGRKPLSDECLCRDEQEHAIDSPAIVIYPFLRGTAANRESRRSRCSTLRAKGRIPEESRHATHIRGVGQSGTQSAKIWVPISWHPYRSYMKTTVEIADSLLQQARKLAAREGVTLRTLVERGLHRVIAETKRGASFKLRRASFKGKGLQPEFRETSWEKVRDLVYKDRGA